MSETLTFLTSADISFLRKPLPYWKKPDSTQETEREGGIREAYSKTRILQAIPTDVLGRIENKSTRQVLPIGTYAPPETAPDTAYKGTTQTKMYKAGEKRNLAQKQAKRERKLAERKAKRLAKEGPKKEIDKKDTLDPNKPLDLDFLTNPKKK